MDGEAARAGGTPARASGELAPGPALRFEPEAALCGIFGGGGAEQAPGADPVGTHTQA